MSKSLIYTAMTTATTVTANGVIPVGTTVRRFGSAIRQVDNTIYLFESGYYNIAVDIVVEPAAAGNISAQVYENGVPITGAVDSNVAAAVSDNIPLHINTVSRVYCCGSKALSVVLSAQGSVVNQTITVVKE